MWGRSAPSRGRSPTARAPRTTSGATIAPAVDTWSGEHIGALVATTMGAALLVAGARRRGDAWAIPAGRGLAVVILTGYICEQLTYALRGQWTAEVNLPLHLTDAVTFAAVAALWRPEVALLVELVYFWA